MPKVTVLVPSYNSERYLDECLSSIASQTLEDIEVICLNDGSTDGTLQIMRSYEAKDSRFRVIDKPNSGYGNTMNQGIDSARGEFFTALESDDVFPKTACQDMYDFIIENDLDYCKADAALFAGDGESRTFVPAPVSQIKASYEDVYNPSLDPGRWFCRSGQPGMYRMSFLNKYGIRHHESPGASFQDLGFWSQVVFCGKRVRNLDKVCYHIRRDNPNSSEVDPSKVYTICGEADFVHRQAQQLEGINHEKCLVASAYFAFIVYRWNCSRLTGDALRAFIERFSTDMLAYKSEGSLDLSYFNEADTNEVTKVMEDPAAYYYENWVMPNEIRQATEPLASENAALRQEIEALRQELDGVYGSYRYRIGTAVTAPGRLLRRDK